MRIWGCRFLSMVKHLPKRAQALGLISSTKEVGAGGEREGEERGRERE
jgi:hypothetical protein